MSTVLAPLDRNLPNLGPLRLLRAQVLNSVPAENSRRNYGKTLDEFFAFWSAKSEPLSRALLMEYRTLLLKRELTQPTINLRLSAVRKLVSKARRNGWIDAELAIAPQRPSARNPDRGLSRVQAKEILRIPDRET